MRSWEDISSMTRIIEVVCAAPRCGGTYRLHVPVLTPGTRAEIEREVRGKIRAGGWAEHGDGNWYCRAHAPHPHVTAPPPEIYPHPMGASSKCAIVGCGMMLQYGVPAGMTVEQAASMAAPTFDWKSRDGNLYCPGHKTPPAKPAPFPLRDAEPISPEEFALAHFGSKRRQPEPSVKEEPERRVIYKGTIDDLLRASWGLSDVPRR